MPSNHYHVCFICRTAVRSAKTDTQLKHCPDCGQTMQPLTYKLAIPKRSKIREWKNLQARVEAFPIQQQIAHVENLNKHLNYQINTLKHQLEYNHPPQRQQNIVNTLNRLLEEQKAFKKRTLLVYRELGEKMFHK